MRKNHILNYALLQQYYFYGLTQMIGIGLITLYCFFGFQSTSMDPRELVELYIPLLVFQLIVFFWLQRFNVDPARERGILWRARLLSLAAWPIYLLAFIGVVRGKRLIYAVTPKGKQSAHVEPSLFAPHFFIASVTLVDILAAFITGHTAPQILFWAVLNTTIMYGLFFSAVLNGNYVISFRRALIQANTRMSAQHNA